MYPSFEQGAGPFGWSVAATGNALIFHSVDHMASLFIHAGPFLTCWSLLGSEPAVLSASYPAIGQMLAGLRAQPPSVSELLYPAVAAYLCWWLPWTLLHLLSGPSEKLLYTRSFERSLSSSALGGLLSCGCLTESPRRCLLALVFCTLHLLLCVSALAGAALLLYWSYLAFTLFCLAMLSSALLNGAARYSKRQRIPTHRAPRSHLSFHANCIAVAAARAAC